MRTPPWVRLVSFLVPSDRRRDWIEEWTAELAAAPERGPQLRGVLSDAWYLRAEAWNPEGIARELRITARTLFRKPLFAVMAGGTLALGIGGVTAVFTLVDGVLLDPLPYPEPDRLVSMNHVGPGLGVDVVGQSEGTYLHYRENTRTLESVAVYSEGGVNIATGASPERVDAAAVSAGFLDVLGVQPALGRGFVRGEDHPDAEPVVLLSHGLWETELGADPAVLGSTIRIDGLTRRVIGVMPDGFAFPDEAELWYPLAVDPADPVVGNLTHIGIARLADGVTAAQADAELHDLLYRLIDERPTALAPRSAMEELGFAAEVQPLKNLFVGEVRDLLWLILGALAFVLLMACANVANLFLLRAEARQSERAVRVALGARQSHLARHSLVESLSLSLSAGALALPLAAFGVAGIVAAAPVEIPRAAEVGLDAGVIAFAVGISLVVGLLLAWVSSRGASSPAIAGRLRDSGRGGTASRGTHRLRNSLAISQVALALVLVAGSGLMARTFVAMRSTDPGFESGSRLTFRIQLPEADYPDEAGVREFHRRLSERLATIPGVLGVGMDTGIPLRGYTDRIALDAVDRSSPEGDLGLIVERRSVTPGYFGTMGIRLDGRDVSWETSEVPGVVVNETLARELWPEEPALGKRLRAGSAAPEWEVVGVAGDVRLEAVHVAPSPLIYLPVGAANRDLRSMDVVLRAGSDPMALVPTIRETLRALDPRLPLIAPQSLEAVVAASLGVTSFVLVLLGIAAGVALLLGMIGIYGVVSWLVGQRTREIGLRIALGAPSASIARRLLGQGLVLTAVGLGIGLVCAWGLGRFFVSFLYGVEPMDAPTLIGTAAFLGLVALAASWIPARRAIRMDPMQALRVE